MRSALMIAALILVALPLQADEKKLDAREIDKQLIEVLKDIHNQGADLYNAGDTAGCYRLFEGSLRTARAVLAHRPAEQKFIDDSLAEAAKQTAPQRAFVLHDSIEKLRGRLKTTSAVPTDKKKSEMLTVPPREETQQKKQPIAKRPPPTKSEQKQDKKEPPIAPPQDPKLIVPLDSPNDKNKPEALIVPPREDAPQKKQPIDIPSAPVELFPKEDKKEPPKPSFPPKDGVMGRLYWQGKPVSGAEIAFVSRGVVDIRVFEARSDSEGLYSFDGVPPGKYTVLLMMSGSQKLIFPERYATTTTSPLIVDVKRGEDTLDLLLQ